MTERMIFDPAEVERRLRANLASGLREIADSLDRGELDGRFVSTVPHAMSSRFDQRLHLRVLLDLAADCWVGIDVAVAERDRCVQLLEARVLSVDEIRSGNGLGEL